MIITKSIQLTLSGTGDCWGEPSIVPVRHMIMINVFAHKFVMHISVNPFWVSKKMVSSSPFVFGLSFQKTLSQRS